MGGNQADANWNTALNWDTAVVPANGDSLVFGAAGSAGTSLNNNISGLSIANLTINSGASAFTIGGNGITLNGTLTEDRFTVPKNFDPKKFFDHSLGVMTGTGDYEVVIKLDAWLTDILRGRKWHPSQVWTELPGGGSHLQMRLSCLDEIEQWVLSWGTRATVIRPAELRDRLFKTTEELWQR